MAITTSIPMRRVEEDRWIAEFSAAGCTHAQVTSTVVHIIGSWGGAGVAANGADHSNSMRKSDGDHCVFGAHVATHGSPVS
jgi:hypothetical protein